MIGQHSAGCDRWHASVDAVEAERAAHEISRRLRGAANARHLDHALGSDAHLVHGINHALGNDVVAASSAQRGLASLIVENGKSDVAGLLWRKNRGHVICPPMS